MRLIRIAAGLLASVSSPASDERLWSPGRQLYATVEQGVGSDWACRITVRANDRRDVSISNVWRRQPDGTGRNAPRECSVRWVDNNRISCQGSINPSTLVLLEFDALTGRELSEHFGLEFTWSPDGQVLASLANVPHFADWREKSDALEIDRKTVYPPHSKSGRHLFHSALTWSPDSRYVAVVDHQVRKRMFTLLVVSRAGKVIEQKLPWPGVPFDEFPAPRDFILRWTGKEIVVEHGGVNRIVELP